MEESIELEKGNQEKGCKLTNKIVPCFLYVEHEERKFVNLHS